MTAIWRFDTHTYPYKLSLKAIDDTAKPKHYIRKGHNRIKMTRTSDPRQVCTRLYPLGSGEGINQLGISGINGGLPYLQSPQEYIDKYGLIERVWIDRRYDNAESLMAAAKVMLDELQEPLVEYETDFVGECAVGDIVQIVGFQKTFITEITTGRDDAPLKTVKIASRPQDIAASVADLADRQRIEMAYGQGATQIYAQSIQANATKEKGAKLNFFIPADMRFVNQVAAKITLNSFRSYSRSTYGGGSTTATSSNGGGGTATSASGGGGTATSASGGSSTPTTSTDSQKSTTSGASSSSTSGSTTPTASAATGTQVSQSGSQYTSSVQDHYHTFPYHNHVVTINIGSHSHGMSHTHSVTIPSHYHTVSIGSHTHTVNLPTHTHNVTLLAHSHTVTLPNHLHDIEQGIFEFGNPTAADILINGSVKGSMTRDKEIDLTEYLIDSSGSIPRGAWMSIEIKPNDLAYVTIDMFVKGFIQSRGDRTV